MAIRASYRTVWRGLLLAGFLLPALASAQNGSLQKITAAAVWEMPDSLRTTILKKCGDATQPASFAQCFMQQMADGGAPPQAVAFTRGRYHARGGEVGIM